MLLVCMGLAPLTLALVLRLIPSRRAREICAVVFSALISGLVSFGLMTGGSDRTELFRLSGEFVCALRLDGAGKTYLGLAAALWPLAVLYAVEYMRHERREGHFFSWFLTAYSAAVFLAAAENLFTLYIFYEMLTLCTVPLVWHKRDEESTRAALAYMLYLIGGAALGFAAVVLVPGAGGGDGAFSLNGNIGLAGSASASLLPWIALLGFLGFGVKAAVLPLCRWLPKASVAPTPVTALLHAVAVVNAGVFAVLRVLYYEVPLQAVENHWVRQAMVILSAATILYGAARAVREKHMKRRLAWSTVSNLSYMLFGLSLLSPAGMEAGLAHMVFHGTTKIILFFCAGSVLTQTGREYSWQMHGLGTKMPVTFVCFFLAGSSLLGVPPLPGFVSKYALITAAFERGDALALVGAICLLIAAVLTAVYVFTLAFPAFFMPLRRAEGEEIRDPGLCMKTSLIALTLLMIFAGVFAGNIMAYLHALAGGGIS